MNNKGFTLIEVLIVVAILGILAAIAVPNLLDAIDRSKQRSSLGEIRQWGISLQEYMAAQSKLPPVTGAAPPCCVAAGGAVDVTLRTALVPFTMNNLPLTDKWLHPYYYDTNELDSYTIRSCGKDGNCAGGVTPGTWYDYNLDIVLNDGIFVNSPI